MPKAPPYVYAKLTWPEINDAVEAGKVPVVPVGSIEQHGPHLPLDVDCVCPTGVAFAAAERLPDQILVLPTIVHGYTAHVMDFPGTINIHYEHFIAMVLDVVKSLAYHGFKKVILLNGHGSNMPNLDLVARREGESRDRGSGKAARTACARVRRPPQASARGSPPGPTHDGDAVGAGPVARPKENPHATSECLHSHRAARRYCHHCRPGGN